MQKAIYNGQIIENNEQSSFTFNRGFLFGDGFFETMRFSNGKLKFEDDHFKRIKNSLELLWINQEFIPNQQKLNEEIKLLLESNKIDSDARIRLTIFRNADGFYLPQNNQSGYFLTCSPLIDKRDNYEEGLRVGIYKEQNKIAGKFSPLKSLSAQLYVMAAIYAKENNFDDVLILNQDNNCIESSNSNLFIVQDKVLITPSLSEGCVDGIFRKNIIHASKEIGIPIKEGVISQTCLIDAQEIFLTNVIRGIQTIKKMDEETYSNSITKKLNDYFQL